MFEIKNWCISRCQNKFMEVVVILQLFRALVSWGAALEVFSYEIVAKTCFTQKVLEKSQFQPAEKLFQGQHHWTEPLNTP